MEQKKKIKIAIIVLAVLLGLSLLALGGTVVYNKLTKNEPAVVTVPDNLITPEEITTVPDDTASDSSDNSDETDKSATAQAPVSSDTTQDNSEDTSQSSSQSGEQTEMQATTQAVTEAKQAAAIELYNKQPRRTRRLMLRICSPATARQNISVFRFHITIKSPFTTKPQSAMAMKSSPRY